MNGISASVLRIFAVLSACSGVLLCAQGSYCEPLRSEVLISMSSVVRRSPCLSLPRGFTTETKTERDKLKAWQPPLPPPPHEGMRAGEGTPSRGQLRLPGATGPHSPRGR